MLSEKGKTQPEVTDLAHITEDEESSGIHSTFAVKSKLYSCLQVLGAFFIFFNVWYVKHLSTSN